MIQRILTKKAKEERWKLKRKTENDIMKMVEMLKAWHLLDRVADSRMDWISNEVMAMNVKYLNNIKDITDNKKMSRQPPNR